MVASKATRITPPKSQKRMTLQEIERPEADDKEISEDDGMEKNSAHPKRPAPFHIVGVLHLQCPQVEADAFI